MENRILITGGAGFIGSHLVESLCGKNKVIVFDTFRRDSLKNTGLMNHENVHVIRGDVRNWDEVSLIPSFTHVIHLSAIAGVDSVMSRPVETMEVALLGTYNLLCLSRERGVERFIDFSTSEVFGEYAYKAKEADQTSIGRVGEARWTYSVSKLASEHLAHSFYKEYGMPTCTLRPFNVFGPNQQGQGAIHEFIRRAIQGEEIKVYGGEQIRSWCYVSDMVDATLSALHCDGAPGNTFNIGNPLNTCTIYHLAHEISDLFGGSVGVYEAKEQDVELRVPSIEKARKILDFHPSVNLRDGLEKTHAWYTRNGEGLSG